MILIRISCLVFLHCPFLKHYAIHIDQIYEKWLEIKACVPTCGAILIDPSYRYVLLVQGYFHLENWGFPKGKIQENELPIQCARREVKNIHVYLIDRTF